MAQPVSQGGIDYTDGGFSASGVIYALLDDLAELAGRLGSIDVYDRRGYVLWWDDFNHGPGAWRTRVDGTGAEVKVSAVYPLWPPYCLKLTAGSDSSVFAEAIKYLAPIASDTLGVEVAIAFQSPFDKLRLEIELHDATQIHRGRIELNDTDQKIYYQDEDDVNQELDDLPNLWESYSTYYNLKLVVDFSTDYYVRFLFGNTSYDLSAYPLRVEGDPSDPHINISIWLYGRVGENDACNLDGVIITQNET